MLFLLFAGRLFYDASTFALYKTDAVTGRERGCYTGIELLLGAKSPTNWVRPAEFVCAGVIGVAALVLLVGRKSK
jgi:hypothetical protein